MQRAPRPDSVSVQTEGSSLKLIHHWFTWQAVFTLAFAFVWNGVVWFGFVSTAWQESAGFAIFPFGFILYLFIMVGAWMAYNALASVFNATVITTDRVALKIRQGPIPWLGNRTLSCNEIRQLYCEEVVGITRGSRRYFHLNAISRDGRKITLAAHISEAAAAIFLEQEIESYLGIPDERVAGEYRHR